MLEQQALLLGDWARPSDGTPVRRIVDPDTGVPLGIARRNAPMPAWLSWLLGPGLAVHETEDESLLFTIRRTWRLGDRWEVRDADEHPVGSVRPPFMYDQFGRCLAVMENRTPVAPIHFRTAQEHQLATLERRDTEVRLEFTPVLDGQPFVKMLVLAAALVCT
jgi:hypothetical protein